MLDPKEIIHGQVKMASIYFSNRDDLRFTAAVEVLESLLPDIDKDADFKKNVKDKTDEWKNKKDDSVSIEMTRLGNCPESQEIRDTLERECQFLCYQVKFRELVKHLQKNNLWLDKELTRRIE